MDKSCVECGKTFTGTNYKNARTTCSETDRQESSDNSEPK